MCGNLESSLRRYHELGAKLHCITKRAKKLFLSLSKKRTKISNKITIIYMVSESWVVRVRVSCGHSYRVRVALWTEFGRVWYKVRSIFRTYLFQNFNFFALLYFHHLFIEWYVWLWKWHYKIYGVLVETCRKIQNTLSFE